MEASHAVIFTESAGNELEAVDALVELTELLAVPVVEAAAPACTKTMAMHPCKEDWRTTITMVMAPEEVAASRRARSRHSPIIPS
jgi:hypothetical protein